MRLHNILIIGLEKDAFNNIDNLLPGKGYFFTYCANYMEIIEHIESGHADLIICDVEKNSDNPFKVYHILEPFFRKNNIPMFLALGQNQLDLIKVALEVGVDNLIFKPYNYLAIDRKIKNQLRKVNNRSFHNSDSFLTYFEYNRVPMLLVQSGKIKSVNCAFSDLLSKDTVNLLNQRFDTVFSFENDPSKTEEFQRLESGLIPYFNLTKQYIPGQSTAVFDLFMVRDTGGNIIVQLNPSVTVMEGAVPDKSEAIKANGFKGTINGTEIKFTKRELEIYKLSANGLPIKVIAQELNLSSRTVEKHRANIMEKVGAKNMIEVINMI